MTPNKTLSHCATNRRKKLTTIIFDTDFFMRPRTRLLIKKHGLMAPTVYMAAVCFMAYEESSDRLDAKAVELLAMDIGCLTATTLEILDTCVELGMLRLDENGAYVSDRIQSEIETVQTKQNNYKLGAQKRVAGQSTRILEDSPESSRIENKPESNSRTSEVRKEQEQEQEKEQEEELDQEREQEPPNPADDALTWAPGRIEAEGALQPAEGAVLRAAGYVALQRRPMRKYAELWLSAFELEDVTKQILDAGIPMADRPKVFAKASAHAKKQLVTSHREPSMMNAYGWLIGFCKTQVLEELSASTKLATNETYLRKARAK